MKSTYILIAVLFLLSVTLMAQENDNNNYPKGTLQRTPEIQRSKTFLKAQGNTNAKELFFENFENGGATWTATGSWQVGALTSGPMSGYNSTISAATNLAGNYADNEDSWLISKPVVLPRLSDQILLKFFEWFELESNYDFGRVKISTDNGTTWTQIFASNGISPWRNTTLDITTYQGKTILLGFNLTTDASVVFSGWKVDDLLIESITSLPLEATMTSFNSQNFPLIYMNVAVDTFGVGMPSLTQANFAAYENEVLQTTLFQVTPPFQGGGQRLADIVFLVDNSGSMGDEQTAIYNNMVAFINQLILSDIDYALGLCRFGQYYNEGLPILEDNGILTTDAVYFRDDVWLRNIASGSIERGYYTITQSSSGFNFRPGAQRIFIILTDETPDQGLATQQEAINACINGSITLYALTNNESAPLNTIATQTNGRYYNITDPFNDILDDISATISNNYIVRYSSSDQNCNGLTRNVKVVVTYNAYQDTATRQYVPCEAPAIQRTPATIALHSQAWIEGTQFTIEVEVTDNFTPYVNLVKLFYKNTALSVYSSVDMTHTSGNLWSGIIPVGSALTPGVDYFITATDGLVTVSDPPIQPDVNPYQLAILPNQAPVIIHTPIEFYDVGIAIDIFAQISDNTNALANQKLFYRMRGQILYENVTMQLLSGNNYHAVIPAGFATIDGIDYYLSAWDNFGVRTDHGSATDPHEINVLDELIVTPANHDVGAGGGSVTYEVQTHLVDWNVTDDADWITINPTSGSGNGTLLVNYTSNSAGVQRVGNITVSSGSGMPPNYLYWFSDTATFAHGFNVSGTNSFSIAARFTPAELAPYNGMYLQLISFFPGELGCNYVLKVWSGIDSSNLVLRHQQLASGYAVDDWNDVVLSSPVLINAAEELWIGYTVTYPTGTYPAVTDNGPCVIGYGDWIYFNNTWQKLSDHGFFYNWLVAGYVDAFEGLVKPTAFAPIGEDQLSDNSANGKLLSKGTINATGNKISKFPHASNESGRVSKTVTLTQAAGGPILDQIMLNAGWNLISFDVTPTSTAPALVFQSLISTGNLQMVTGFQNQIGVFFNPNGPVYLNTLQNLAAGEGYWVKVQNPATLTIQGPPIPPAFAINLKTGWNLIGYWPYSVLTPDEAFAPLITAGILQMVTGYNMGGKFFNPFGPPFLNTLTELENGFGYWVKLSTNYNNFSYPTSAWSCGDHIYDDRDGQTYSTVQIGTQCWMKENLNVGTRINGSGNQTNNGTLEKYCYNNLETNCYIYGGLYQWDEMMQYTTTAGVQGICPTGWHLPTDGEWTALTTYVSSQPANLCNSNSTYIAKALAAKTNWTTDAGTCAVGNNLAANNATGFTALPGGIRHTDGSYDGMGYIGHWWSSSQHDATYAWYRDLGYSGAQVYRYDYYKSRGFSVRCLKD